MLGQGRVQQQSVLDFSIGVTCQEPPVVTPWDGGGYREGWRKGGSRSRLGLNQAQDRVEKAADCCCILCPLLSLRALHRSSWFCSHSEAGRDPSKTHWSVCSLTLFPWPIGASCSHCAAGAVGTVEA